jgi:hypothetical protein
MEGASYGKIAQEVGIYRGCVQNLCRAIGIQPRENRTTSIADVWEQRLTEYVLRTGAKVIGRPGRLTKKSRILMECDHGISERPCQILESLQHCCRSSALLYNKRGKGGQGWGVNPKYRNLPGTLYLIRYLDEDGTHFKVGITKLKLSERFSKGQLISIIHLHNATLGECFDLEQSLLKWAKDNGHRYSSPTTTELIHPDGLPYLLDRLTPLSFP